jgi:hypothetical protein
MTHKYAGISMIFFQNRDEEFKLDKMIFEGNVVY